MKRISTTRLNAGATYISASLSMTVVSGLEPVFIIFCFGEKPPVMRGGMPAMLELKENSVRCS